MRDVDASNRQVQPCTIVIMDLNGAGAHLADAMSAQLLVRDATPRDRLDQQPVLEACGWTPTQLAAWAGEGPAVVLYDPADDEVRGLAVARPIGPATFELAGWAVDGVPDHTAAAERLVRGIADRLRRAGAERLVVEVNDGLAARLLVGSGFHPVHRGAGADEEALTLYQEL
jgi:hypothetical protein